MENLVGKEPSVLGQIPPVGAHIVLTDIYPKASSNKWLETSSTSITVVYSV